MNKLKTLTFWGAAILSPALAFGIISCSSNSTSDKKQKEEQGVKENELKVATFNLSLAVDGAPSSLKYQNLNEGLLGSANGSDTYARWVNYFSIAPTEQDTLVDNWIKWRKK